ncbi:MULTISPECIES: CU044_2847 family protein [unclassified Butyrivibrio]|uniref:CU044_2847 family protein n=1 Tax=unclassified Butyrivibrio TaxID=2639466 RepID=UPI00040F4EAE|nr:MULTISPECIES: CU044_2847 family protein [unclassified Butyrivibrio]SCY76613.1 hypothetical protein SAMN02910371_03790 [Butyrivibrio sp. INlla14]
MMLKVENEEMEYYIEPYETEGSGMRETGVGPKAITQDLIDNVGKTIGNIYEGIKSQVSEISSTADEIEIECGISLNTEGKIVVISGKVEGNFRVKMKWVNKK